MKLFRSFTSNVELRNCNWQLLPLRPRLSCFKTLMCFFGGQETWNEGYLLMLFSHQSPKVAHDMGQTSAHVGLRAGNGWGSETWGGAGAGGGGCAARQVSSSSGCWAVEDEIWVRSMAAISRNAKTFLEMELDGKNVFTRIISKKRIGRNHFMRWLRISVEIAMGFVQVKVIQGVFLFCFVWAGDASWGQSWIAQTNRREPKCFHQEASILTLQTYGALIQPLL